MSLASYFVKVKGKRLAGYGQKQFLGEYSRKILKNLCNVLTLGRGCAILKKRLRGKYAFLRYAMKLEIAAQAGNFGGVCPTIGRLGNEQHASIHRSGTLCTVQKSPFGRPTGARYAGRLRLMRAGFLHAQNAIRTVALQSFLPNAVNKI